jgi:RNA polymerase sigma factor (sigma-70 family)
MGEMQPLSDAQLLRDYAERGAEAAFAEIVARYTDLVYSAALRQVYSPDLADDVTQGVFTDLARKARTVSANLSPEASLVGWLYRGTRFAARDLYRNETRRTQRERQAMEQLHPAPESPPDWDQLRPVLDDAMSELDDTDRDAVLLRYFKNHDLRTIGATLGISDDAAQKRVSRAVERLRESFAKRGVTVGASGLAVVISANAVQAAPVGLAPTIATAAALTGTTLATTATVTATKAIAMTTLQKTLITTTITILAGAGIYEARLASQLRNQVQTLQQQQAPLAEQIQELQREHDETTRQLASLRDENERLNRNTGELLRLRGEVSLLRRAQDTAGKSANSNASQADTTTNQEQAAINIGRTLGLAVVRGDAGALDKVAELSKAAHKNFNTNRVGLDDTQRGELSSRTFAPIQAAFDVIGEAAAAGNQVAIEAVEHALQIPELKGGAVEIVGILAGKGNEAAIEMLINPDKYGILLSSSVFALRSAADAGYQSAIDALAAVAKNENQKVLWLGAADGLNAAAGSGNAVAIDALISLSTSTNQNVRSAVIPGLEKAAANQNAKAAETLRVLRTQQ